MGTTRKLASQNLQSGDFVNSLIIAILGVEVRRQMVIVEHANHDAEEVTEGCA
jgi:hypothetical protein